MKTYPGYRYDYVIANETWWYSEHRGQQPMIYIHRSVDEQGRGSAWEFAIVENGSDTLQIRMSHDAWQAFEDAPELFEALCITRPANLNALRTTLDHLGFIDATQRTNPADGIPSETRVERAAYALAVDGDGRDWRTLTLAERAYYLEQAHRARSF